MIHKLKNKVLAKVKESNVSEFEKKLNTLAIELKTSQDENNRLIRELIIEQRLREDRDLHGGIFQTSQKEIVTKIFNDLIMYLDPTDIAVVPHIALEGIWERQITDAWLHAIQKRDIVVFDIGANFGYFGMLAAQKLDKKKSKVVMFEANPKLLPYIHKTLSVNWLNENTIVENLGVSDTNGSAKLNVLEDYIGSTSMHSIEHLESYLGHKMKVKAESIIEVETITIDTYCKKNSINQIDIMKMDIEGYEEKAYAGMKNIVKNSPNFILFIEFTKDGYDQPEQFYNQMLNDFGNIYTINTEGHFEKPKNTSYESVVERVDDWIMLAFSKRALSSLGSQEKNN